MSLKLSQFAAIGSDKSLSSENHILLVLTEKEEFDTPFAESLRTKLKRTNSEYKDLTKSPVSLDLPNGGIASFVVLAEKLNMFQRHVLLRKAAKCIRC